MNKKTVKDMTVTALLIALAIMIPVILKPFAVVVGDFTATPAAHVPLIIALFISPWSSALVALGSGVGFSMLFPPIVAYRAFSHIIFAIIGAYMIKKRIKLFLVIVVTMLIHAAAEALTVLLLGNSALAIVTGIGTMAHHTVDFIIAIAVVKALVEAKVINKPPKLLK